MEENPTSQSDSEPQLPDLRCPQCDSVVPAGSDRCIMCGAHLSDSALHTDQGREPAQTAVQEARPLPPQSQRPSPHLPPNFLTDTTEVKERRHKRALYAMIAAAMIITALFSFMILRSQGSEVLLALQPTFTPLPPPPSSTPTFTPQATETVAATETAVPTATPIPTDTPRPARFHSVASGETLFGLSLLYRVSAGSIAAENDIPIESPIQVGQELSVPWPTATPPLESMVLEVGGELIVADVTDCEIVTIQEGDSTYGLSAQRGVPAEAIVAVNRLTEESIQLLHPGDTLCIPRVAPGDALPPTAGPLPTASMTAFPAGPALLYPVEGAELDPADGLLRLQWLSVKDLADEERYMVEMTDLDQLDALPHRAFTRDTSLKVPDAWRPAVAEIHEVRWRVSIVRVTGARSDGGIIYEYGGRSSEDSHFFWLGAEPTATPTLTPVPTETPVE